MTDWSAKLLFARDKRKRVIQLPHLLTLLLPPTAASNCDTVLEVILAIGTILQDSGYLVII